VQATARLRNNHKMKNKTIATWLAFWTGPLGLHRFYLYGFTDMLAWLLPIPTALGFYGLERVQQFGPRRHAQLVADSFAGVHDWRAAL
jgi:hypothetical protein